MRATIDEMGVQVVDHCNLNCKGCLHFCHKSQKSYFYKPECYENDLKKLISFVNINVVRIYGGEPLLHPRLRDIIKITHIVDPNLEIRLFTNGLLLKTMSSDLVSALRSHNVKIIWSVYPIIDENAFTSTCAFLEDSNLSYNAERTDLFYSCLCINGDINPQYAFERCNGRNCHIMQDGKISLCPAPMVAKAMRDLDFNYDFSDGLLDLYNPNMTAEQIVSFLSSPHSGCRFCTAPYYFPWEQQSGSVSLTDWVSKHEMIQRNY